MSTRIGRGIKRGWQPSPALVAERLARMNGTRRQRRAEREAAARRLAEELAGMPLETLVKGVTTRQWTVGVMHLGGYGVTEIAQALGYATVDGVNRVLKQPEVVRLIELVRRAQLERVLQGTYGVAAQAKAAAPLVMEHVVELAGAKKDRASGERIGRARRDADALKAAELTLTVSGHKIERTAHVHLHLLEELSETELEALASRGEWPARYESVAGLVPGPQEGTP
jgi:hypothetical protein